MIDRIVPSDLRAPASPFGQKIERGPHLGGVLFRSSAEAADVNRAWSRAVAVGLGHGLRIQPASRDPSQ